MIKLGKLTKVNDLRKVWSSEPYDFTPWLAKEENLEVLGNEVGLEIELIETEAKTGTFSTDILAKDAFTEDCIIIENQLEETDHDHLGKLMVYAAGHDAKTIIWIVKNVREEHRQAIDWLNEHTDTEVNIFLIKIELWKIGDSDIAPKFNIISSPNNWSKTVKNSHNTEQTNSELLQLEYWNEFSNFVDNNSSIFKSRNYQQPHNWYSLPLGKDSHIELNLDSNKKTVSTQVYIPDNKKLFDYLLNQKEQIEEEMDHSLLWDKKEKRKLTKITISHNLNPTDKNNWEKSVKLHLEDAEKIYSVFKDKIDEYFDNE